METLNNKEVFLHLAAYAFEKKVCVALKDENGNNVAIPVENVENAEIQLSDGSKQDVIIIVTNFQIKT